MLCFIARSQMFLDGNKRVAQLMCNKIMMQNDIGIFSIPYDDIDMFKKLLVDFYETNESYEIKDFFRKKCLLLNPEYIERGRKSSEMSIAKNTRVHR